VQASRRHEKEEAMTTQTYEERMVTLTRAIRDHAELELDSIRDAGTHGADSGFAGFTYTADGADFYRANSELIDEMLQEAADDFGHKNVAELVATFTRADMTDTRDGHDCLLAWYALEEAGRFWNDRKER
jgi:hypothetical protein